METSLPLTEEMRQVTKKVHQLSNQLVTAKALIAFTDRKLYGEFVLMFYFIYYELEKTLERCKTVKTLAPLHAVLPKITRMDRFDKDLKFYLGKNWHESMTPSAKVLEYLKDIQQLEKENPTLLLSYYYHMYAALLAGGQILKKMAIKGMGLVEKNGKYEGVEVYEFPCNQQENLFQQYKDIINAIPLKETERKLVLQQSIHVFHMNNQLFQSIQGTNKKLFRLIVKSTFFASMFLLMIYWIVSSNKFGFTKN